MSAFTVTLPSGVVWTPAFVSAIDPATCIACGRCFKVCSRGVLALRGVDEEGELVEDDEDEEVERRVMTVARQEDCIGCQACAKVCSRRCFTHAALTS